MKTYIGSRGHARIERLFNAEEIGVAVPEPHPDRALRIFLEKAAPHGKTAYAPRTTQMRNGVLFLCAVADTAPCGTIYIYSRDSGEFYVVGFTGDEDNITTRDYEQLVHEYGLLEYAAQAPRIDECFAAGADTNGVLPLWTPDELPC